MKKSILPLLLAIALASCATPPRAILPPTSVVAQIETSGVEGASKATRNAVREIAKAGQETRTVTQKLRAEIDRAEILAQANEQLREAFISIQVLADDLAASLGLAEEKEAIALRVIDNQEDEINILKANAKAQAVQIEGNAAEKVTLRNQVEALSSASDDLAIAKDRNKTQRKWMWKLGIIAGLFASTTALLGYLLLKP